MLQTEPAARDKQESSEPGATPLGISLQEYERLKAERDQLFDRLARMQAEFDNARKREARERAEFREFAIADAVEQFLPVIDNFQLALKAGGTPSSCAPGWS